MLTVNATLAIFTMLGLSSFTIFWSKKIKIPQTVLLVAVGIILGSLAYFPTFTFFKDFTLTPELLFYLLLPTLIFESAYNINARRMIEDKIPILVLSIMSFLISTVLIGTALFYILPLFNFTLPYTVTLLFGSLISATDPVAVLALFKEFGAPRRLSLIFEGESLFNDATAVALFLVLLDIVLNGFNGATTLTEGTISFISMLIGGVLFGLFMGGIFAKVVGVTRESEVASITLTLVLAHITFILSEVLSESLHIGTVSFPLSPIIATTVASLVMGNYGRAKIHPRAEQFVEKLWEQFAFMANSLVFILIGVLVTTIPTLTSEMFIVIVLTVLIVATARMLSIYPVVYLLNLFTSKEQYIPTSWQHLLSWGSLRGALAITMVLLIPDTLVIPGWDAYMSVKEFMLSLTIGCILTTLFLKATTISTFMKKLKLDKLTVVEEIEYQEAQALIHHEVSKRLETYTQRGYIDKESAHSLRQLHDQQFKNACRKISDLSQDTKADIAHRVLRMFAIGIEKRNLKELYHHNEVTEIVFRRLNGKLQLQLEAIEAGNLQPNMSIHTDSKDIFENMATWVRTKLSPVIQEQEKINTYIYYRAQVILSRKVLKELLTIEQQYARNIFTPTALKHVTELYTTFKQQSTKKMEQIHNENPNLINTVMRDLAQKGVHKIEESILKDLFEKELITPKLFITLKEELKNTV